MTLITPNDFRAGRAWGWGAAGLMFALAVGGWPCCMACAGQSPAAKAGVVTAPGNANVAAGRLNFVNDVVPVLTKFGCNSGGCHGRGSGQNGFKLSLFGFDPAADYAALVEEGLGRRISPTAPDESLMLMKATGKIPHGGGVRFDDTSDAYKLIRRWIAEGTPWTDEHDPTLVGILVEPAEQIMTPEANQQLKVTARYSDGSTRDVTATSRILQPAAVAVANFIRGAGPFLRRKRGRDRHGALLGHRGRVAADGSVCRGQQRSRRPRFEPKNFIDRLVQEKWTKLGLAPSLAASDAVFVRRAYLDAIGTLPTPQEVREFLADPSPDKRDKLVDRLLERPEYAIYWAQQWGDILRNKQISADHKPNSTKFAEWLRNAFAQNMPYDKFARELIAVSGKVEDHPQMDWYRQLNSNENRVEDTSQVFLGHAGVLRPLPQSSIRAHLAKRLLAVRRVFCQSRRDDVRPGENRRPQGRWRCEESAHRPDR